jgi:hypothetical protein
VCGVLCAYSNTSGRLEQPAGTFRAMDSVARMTEIRNIAMSQRGVVRVYRERSARIFTSEGAPTTQRAGHMNPSIAAEFAVLEFFPRLNAASR